MKRSRKDQDVATIDLLVLAEVVEQFASKTIVLLGDFVADEFQFGEISRVSREAPVLILRHRQTEILPGGGANAANNFAALGARVLPVSVVGEDNSGDALLRFFRERKIELSGILRIKNWTTPTKTRFLAGWAHTVGQQVLRVDREPATPLADAIREKLSKKLASHLSEAAALAISDYGFGVASPEMVKRAMASVNREIPVTLDARYNLSNYSRAGITSATPNEAELELAHHTTIGNNIAELERTGRLTLSKMKLASLLVTRGRHGMALFAPGETTAHVAVHGSDQAVDVTGAGDTVLAAYTLALACGATKLEAAHIANIAGGLVVMKRGTATITRTELLEAIRSEAGASR